MDEEMEPPPKKPKVDLEPTNEATALTKAGEIQDGDFTKDVESTTDRFATDENKYNNFIHPDELERLREFHVLDEVRSNDEDSNNEDSDSSDGVDGKSDVPEDEIEKMLEEDLPEDFKGAPKQKEKVYITRQKVVLEEKGVNTFEVLPLDWMMVRHYSGMPVYMHRTSRVCTLSKPYFLGKGNTRRHDIPISAIPCLAYRKALVEEERQKEIDKRIEEQIKSGTWKQMANKNKKTVQNTKTDSPKVNDVCNSKETKSVCPFQHETGTDENKTQISENRGELMSETLNSKSEGSANNNNCDEIKSEICDINDSIDIEMKSVLHNNDDRSEAKKNMVCENKNDVADTDKNISECINKQNEIEIIKPENEAPTTESSESNSQDIVIESKLVNSQEAKKTNSQNDAAIENGIANKDNANNDEIADKDNANNDGIADKDNANNDGTADKDNANNDGTADKDNVDDDGIADKDNANNDGIADKDNANNDGIADKDNANNDGIADKDNANNDGIADKDNANNDEIADKDNANNDGIADKDNANNDGIADKDNANNDGIADKDNANNDEIADKDNANNDGTADKDNVDDDEIPLNCQPVVLPGGIVMPPPRVETVSTSWKSQHLTHEQVNSYCKNLFKFKTVSIMHFKRWADRRKYAKARKTLQCPPLPEGTKLITIPAQPANGQQNGGKTNKRDCVMNMNGRSYLSVFHEYVRRALQKQPMYEFKQLENAATPYQATVYIGGMQYGVGHGSSKRSAKSAAARASIHILIPEMRTELDQDRPENTTNNDPDFSFFDCVGIEDPRITEFCAATCEPSPHAILRTCLLRNFGAQDKHIHTEMKKLEYQKIELTMKVGKHTATVVCKNKKTAKQRASQAILQALHPHVRSWGSLLRLYGSRSVKSCKEKKLEEQQITLLQDAARHNEPNYAVLEKLRHEMRKLRERDEAVVPIGTFLITQDLPTHSGSNLNNVDL